jgi:hypothetical protein
MKTIMPNGSTRRPIKEAIAVACGVGLLLCAGVNSADAAKISRDHRGPGASSGGGVKVTNSVQLRQTKKQVESRPTTRCPGGPWGGGACRSHRIR